MTDALGELIDIRKGRKPITLLASPGDDSLPYLTTSYFRDGEPSKFVPSSEFEQVVVADPGDVVLLWDGANAGEVFTGLSGVIASTMALIDPTETLDRYFLYLYLRFKRQLLSGRTTGSTIPHVSRSVLTKLDAPKQPLSEQRAIAHVLRTVQQAKEATEQVIAAARELKKSLMRHLFTYGPTPPKLADVEFAPDGYPSHWTILPIRQVADVMVSSADTRALAAVETHDGEPTKVLYLKVSDLAAGGARYVDRSVTEFLIEPEEVNRLRLVPPGSTIFPKRGAAISTNRKRQNAKPAALDPNLVAVVPLRVDPDYLYRWFEEFDLRKLVPPDVIPQINKKDIAPLEIGVPPAEEQAEVARLIDAVDDKIASEKARHDALNSLFESLLHDLMTGRLLIADLEVSA